MIELFRKEVLERHSSRLHGDINLALPMGWHVLGYLFLAALLAGAAFLSTASYTRAETVPGIIIPDKGVAAVLPTRAGVLTELHVGEGMRVSRGMPIARVRVAETLASGGAASDQLTAVLAAQQRSLAGQSDALAMVNEQERARRVEQARGLERELGEIAVQIEIQRQLVESARENLDRTGDAARRGFISRRDILAREEMLMVRRQQLAQLEQARAGKRAALSDAQRAIAQLEAQTLADSASARVRLDELGRQRVDAEAAEGYLVTAPIDGVATAVAARIGQAVDPASAILSILPAGSALRAELLVPASAIGFIAEGQDVRLAIDGFPVQQFGSVDGRIVTVPSAPVPRRDAQGNLVSVYPVLCEVRDTRFASSGLRHRLVAGMTLSARISTRRQSLLEWLFEPLFRAT